MKFWAYRDTGGVIHVKTVRNIGHAREAIEDAFDSKFVDDVLDVYEADTRSQAETIAKERLSKKTAPKVELDAEVT